MTHHSHHISWFPFWKKTSTGIHPRVQLSATFTFRIKNTDIHFAKILFRLTTRKTSNGDSWRIPRYHFGAALFPQLQVQPSLDNTE